MPDLPPNLLRPALEVVQPYQPGRPIDEVKQELGLDSVVKLASNEGPWPPFPAAVQAIRDCAEDQRLYPDPGAWALRDALSERLSLPTDQIMVGAGIDGLITSICRATLDPGDALALGWPSFVQWRLATLTQGGEIQTAELARNGSYDLDALLAAITPATKLAVVVSPNNPTGGAVAATDLEGFLDRLPGHVMPLLDEAYFEYLPPGGHDGAELLRDGRRLAVFRTFSKAYGLAGLRVGYVLGPAKLLAGLAKVRNAFDVTGPAQVAALASVRSAPEHLSRRMDEIATERSMLASGLSALGLQPLPSAANFVLVPMGTAERANAVNDALLRLGVIVRPAGPFGAPDALRITVGLAQQNARLLAALASALN
ncbi:MAG: histidinol-phosphate transaminase [Thermoleophilia bacterium]|nr:histidinol-phosphate transaminase [Thermoleophilia bacterium]